MYVEGKTRHTCCCRGPLGLFCGATMGMGSPKAVCPAWNKTRRMGVSLGTVGVTRWALRSSGGIISLSVVSVPLGRTMSRGSGTRRRTGTVCFVLKGPYVTRMATGWLEGKTVKCSVVIVLGSPCSISKRGSLESRAVCSTDEDEDDLELMDREGVNPVMGPLLLPPNVLEGRMKNPPSLSSKWTSRPWASPATNIKNIWKSMKQYYIYI